MSYYVSSLTLLQTSNCPYAFRCLKTGECASPARCETDKMQGLMVLLKNKDPLERCPYRLGVGPKQFCMCPTYVELNQQKKDLADKEKYSVRRRADTYNNHGEIE